MKLLPSSNPEKLYGEPTLEDLQKLAPEGYTVTGHFDCPLTLIFHKTVSQEKMEANKE